MVINPLGTLGQTEQVGVFQEAKPVQYPSTVCQLFGGFSTQKREPPERGCFTRVAQLGHMELACFCQAPEECGICLSVLAGRGFGVRYPRESHFNCCLLLCTPEPPKDISLNRYGLTYYIVGPKEYSTLTLESAVFGD